jgi:vancomycin permeability regulator SanA
MTVTRRRAGWFAAGALAVVLVAPLLWVQGLGQTRVRSADAVPPTAVALVLGAGLAPDGTPSPYLERRLAAARDLYRHGVVGVVLVSGDNRTASHDEPTAMRDWLVQNGVPRDKVVRDPAGFDTHDSCVRAHDVFGVTDAVVVTQDYHVRRALLSCAQAGIDVVGVGVSSQSAHPSQAVVWHLREVPASWRAAWDAVTGRPALRSGPAQTSVRDALDAAP